MKARDSNSILERLHVLHMELSTSEQDRINSMMKTYRIILLGKGTREDRFEGTVERLHIVTHKAKAGEGI